MSPFTCAESNAIVQEEPIFITRIKLDRCLIRRLNGTLLSIALWITDVLFSWDLGGVPYPTLTNSELCRLIDTGYRMEKPDMCSDEV